ncbi:GspH/FimT family pseudopilin [Acidobacteriota bacterium]
MARRRQEGFSLSEILVVLAIVATFLMMLIPSLDTFLPRIRFESTCRQIASDISVQRLRAVERRETTTITYTDSSKTYEMQPYGIRRALSTDITSVTFPDVNFNSRGMIPSGTEVTVTINGRDSQQRQIKVSPAGRIKFITP